MTQALTPELIPAAPPAPDTPLNQRSTELAESAQNAQNAQSATDARAAAAAERKSLQQKRRGHATHGASSRNYAVPAGREAIPVATESEREQICSFTPVMGPQITRLRRHFRQILPSELRDADDSVILQKLKSGTLDEALAMSLLTELLKANKRDPFSEGMLDYFIAPAGLSAESHHMVRVLVDCVGPRHILAWAKDQSLPVYQDLAQEVSTAWTDPEAEHLTCCSAEVPSKPNATTVKPYLQALSERAARWPEAMRPIIGDLIKVLKECQPSKLHDYLVTLQHLLTLSSKALHDELLALGQKLPKNFALAALIMPQAWEQAGCNLHKFLMATKLQPKKAPAKKRSSKRTAKAKLPELAPAPQADATELVPVAADEATATSELPELAPAPQADATELVPVAADEATATSELPELAPAPQADATELAPVAEDKGAEASTDAQGATAVDASQAVDAFLAAKYNELRSATRGTHKLNPLACAVRTMLTAGPADADAAYEQDAILAPTMEAGAPAHADNPSSEPAAVMVELPSAVEPVQAHAGLSAWERKHQRKLQRQQRKQARRHTSSGTGCPACGR